MEFIWWNTMKSWYSKTDKELLENGIKKLVFQDEEMSFYLFEPDFFICMMKKREDVSLFTDIHWSISYINMHICSGRYKILYCEKNNETVSYVIYTRCRRHVFNSGNKNDYYVIFYYTYQEYRGYGYAKILIETLFRLIDDNNDFY